MRVANGMPASVVDWTTAHVKEWLIRREFTTYAHLLCDIHRIDGTALLMLTEDDLKSPPINIEILGDVKKLALSLYHLRSQHKEEIIRLGLSPCLLSDSLLKNYAQKSESKRGAGGYSRQNSIGHFPYTPVRERSLSPESSISTFFLDDLNSLSPADGNPHSFGMAKHLEPEIWKTLLSITYFVTVTCITAMVMVVVHDRVPDMKKYPPLPDIFLDNVPLIPWAFDMCEVCGCLLTMTWFLVLIFHKHRFILMRRFFALTGSVFLLRCVTMLITSLSVPGAHLACAPRPYGDIWAKLEKALDIWRGFGMSVRGVRTCGDYMFSGHTVVLTTLNFFITEYTPRRLYFLHTFTWILNLFGIFFILAAHEHYSIDVFVAFYITSRLFLYYHTLANSRALRQRDQARAKIWFPLFSFFEARIDGMIPNEYQMPWANLSLSSLFKYGKSLVRPPQPHTHATKSTPDGDKRSGSHKKPKKKAA